MQAWRAINAAFLRLFNGLYNPFNTKRETQNWTQLLKDFCRECGTENNPELYNGKAKSRKQILNWI